MEIELGVVGGQVWAWSCLQGYVILLLLILIIYYVNMRIHLIFSFLTSFT
jgi:hypothetical protein